MRPQGPQFVSPSSTIISTSDEWIIHKISNFFVPSRSTIYSKICIENVYFYIRIFTQALHHVFIFI